MQSSSMGSERGTTSGTTFPHGNKIEHEVAFKGVNPGGGWGGHVPPIFRLGGTNI